MKKYLVLAALAAMLGAVSCTSDEKTTPAEPISASPKSVTLDGDGTPAKVAVKSSFDTFEAKADASWLEIQIDGKEITLSAGTNTTKAERSCTLTISDKESECTVDVKQSVGSPVAGYAAVAAASFEYAGNSLYIFIKPLTEDYGGMGYLRLEDLDGNELYIELFTPLYAGPEEVELPEGTYTLGQDETSTYYAVPFTWIAGTTIVIDDETLNFGSCLAKIDGTEVNMASGTIEIKDGIIKTDLKDAEGNEYKYAFDGEVTIDTESAGYPSEKGDPSENIHYAECSYNGVNSQGAAEMILILYSGDEENPNLITYEFYMPAKEFDEIDDISGNYYTPAEDGEEVEGDPWTISFGALLDFGGFTFPMGSSIIYASGDFFVADGFASLVLTKKSDGEYDILGAMANPDFSEMHFFEATLPIELYDESDIYEED